MDVGKRTHSRIHFRVLRINETRTDADPNVLSNSDVVCEHGKLDPGKPSNMKRIRRVRILVSTSLARLSELVTGRI